VSITAIINCFKHVGIIGPDVEELSTESKESTSIAYANILSMEEPECITKEIQIYENVSNENWEDMIHCNKKKFLCLDCDAFFWIRHET